MLETGGAAAPDSELTLDTANCTQRSSNSTQSNCSTSFSRLSFDLLPTSSPENLSLKPHRSSDFAYSAILRRKTALTFHDFCLIRRIGAGDIGTVYLCRLRNSDNEDEQEEKLNPNCLYAMKVVDKNAVALKKKSQRAEMERRILKMLDHPFLPTLFAEFEASHFSCIVMEFCSGGDLHSLRHKFPHNPVQSSDCFHDTSFPSALQYSATHTTPFSCFPNRMFRSRKVQTVQPDRFFVAEPVSARSCSFVGTHEYVSPEVAAGGSHGNAVDWWSFGVFIYELIYGRTPYVAQSNEATLRNIIKNPLRFPTATPSSALERHARDLICALLHKDPGQRLGSKRGAADVKKHPFFKGLNMALIRMLTPPQVPGLKRHKTTSWLTKDDSNNLISNSKKQYSTASFDYFF
ncbi:hypothetical protein Ahy_B03g062326 [Arachis hypogaea]|uniref:non-specific serine/threonine protein kinase n=1 Tax=Arachis hypogaea TaxID=3818 RepID=A0A444ZTX3_ARAHY|nr:hypothetical protein Ahy_B03g062326 [Arachis hypogaea]